MRRRQALFSLRCRKFEGVMDTLKEVKAKASALIRRG